MRTTLNTYYDRNHNSLVKDKSVVRYEDLLWIFHGGWLDPKTGRIKVLLSSLKNGKMRLVHDRHRKKITLEYTMK